MNYEFQIVSGEGTSPMFIPQSMFMKSFFWLLKHYFLFWFKYWWLWMELACIGEPTVTYVVWNPNAFHVSVLVMPVMFTPCNLIVQNWAPDLKVEQFGIHSVMTQNMKNSSIVKSKEEYLAGNSRHQPIPNANSYPKIDPGSQLKPKSSEISQEFVRVSQVYTFSY